VLSEISRTEPVTVLASAADWAWPVALHNIFEPRGVKLIVADRTVEFIGIIEQNRIHAAIIDVDFTSEGFVTLKIIRNSFPWLPCLLLKSRPDECLLSRALQLDVFSVLDKPVDMKILQQQLDRIFTKMYKSSLFAD
jgi:DNA-binding NtrC family response regulator